MKFNTIFLILISLIFFSCEEKATLTFQNSLNTKRTDEFIVLTRADLSEKMELKAGLLPIFKIEEDKIIPSQVDDLDGDGNWDEAVLILDFEANQTLEIEVDLVPEAEYPEFEKRTNLRLGIHLEDGTYKEVDNYRALPCNEEFKIISQAEGVNWENDKIGFRVYFDCRNVKDLFGKRLPAMVLDKVHTPGFGSYHELADWGMDVLHCGSSLGSGGLALMRNDSLYRLGSTDIYEYQKIVEGPFRSIFELRYSGWHVENDVLEAVERITIYPGKYWFESDVIVKGGAEGDQIVTGIVTTKLKDEPFKFVASDFQCIGTHGIQSLNNDELGMAVLVPQNETEKIGRTTDINFFKLGYKTVPKKSFSNIISETYYISQKLKRTESSKHYFFSVWGLDKEEWKTEAGFKKYIGEESKKLSAPINSL